MPVIKFPYTAEGRQKAKKAQSMYGGRLMEDTAPVLKKGGPVKKPAKKAPRKR